MRILLLLSIITSSLFAASGETGFEFLQFDKSTYELARNRNVALSSNPINGVFNNPASLDNISKNGFVSSHFSLQILDTKLGSLIGGYSIDSNQNVGLGIAVTDYGDFIYTSLDNPYGDGSTFKAQEGVLQASYSYRVLKNLVIGGAPLFAYQKYEKYSASALAINVGAIYSFEKYRLAINGKNLGMQITTLLENSQKEKLPYTATIAFGNLSKERFNWEIDITEIYKQQTQFGFSSNYHINRLFNFYLGVTLTSDRLSYVFDDIDASDFYFDESRLISTGIELNYLDFNLIFGLSYAGSAFAPLTSFGLNYSF